jgi:hypothetical protein
MTQLLVLPVNLAVQIDTDKIKGISNVFPVDTVRYNLDKDAHIKAALVVDDLSQYIMDMSEIRMWVDDVI